jgi:hypothetical protein
MRIREKVLDREVVRLDLFGIWLASGIGGGGGFGCMVMEAANAMPFRQASPQLLGCRDKKVGHHSNHKNHVMSFLYLMFARWQWTD